MKKNFKYILGKNNIVIIYGNQIYTINHNSAIFDSVYLKIINGDMPKDEQSIEKFINGVVNLEIDKLKIDKPNQKVYYNNERIPEKLEKLLLIAINNNDMENSKKIKNFIINSYKNKFSYIIEELYDFISNGTLGITEDGCILAYKKVRNDYLDIYTGKIDNSVGSILPKLDENEVDPDRTKTCSKGYHFCSYEYLSHYGSGRSNNDKIMIVKVNPKDIIAIPNDYNNQKGRAITYEIVDEIEDIKEINKKKKKSDINKGIYVDKVQNIEIKGVKYKVLLLLQEGKSIEEISQKLNIKTSTVKKYISAIKKMGIDINKKESDDVDDIVKDENINNKTKVKKLKSLGLSVDQIMEKIPLSKSTILKYMRK